MILVANEFNEIQVERAYPLELLLVIYGFFMIGLKWENLSALIPTLTTTVDAAVPRNYILKFFLSIFLLFLIGAILYCIKFSLYNTNIKHRHQKNHSSSFPNSHSELHRFVRHCQHLSPSLRSTLPRTLFAWNGSKWTVRRIYRRVKTIFGAGVER